MAIDQVSDPDLKLISLITSRWEDIATPYSEDVSPERLSLTLLICQGSACPFNLQTWLDAPAVEFHAAIDELVEAFDCFKFALRSNYHLAFAI
jgi:hypothetical protein